MWLSGGFSRSISWSFLWFLCLLSFVCDSHWLQVPSRALVHLYKTLPWTGEALPSALGVLWDGSEFSLVLGLAFGSCFCSPFRVVIKLLCMQPAKQELLCSQVCKVFKSFLNPRLRALVVPLQIPWLVHWWDQRSKWEWDFLSLK